MSHIINSEKELQVLNDYYKKINISKLDIELLNDIMKYIIPRDINGRQLIRYNVSNSMENISFIPEERVIEVPINKLSNWAIENGKINDMYYNCGDRLNSYLLLFSMLHEVEHSYQFLMGEKVIECPEIVQKVYKEIMGLMIESNYKTIKDKILRNKILKRYDKYHDSFFIERNANVGAGSVIVELALLNNDKTAINIFGYLLSHYMCQGYLKNTKGCIYNTYKYLHLLENYNTYSKDDICDEDRVRYGLEINEDIRNTLLEKNIKLKKLIMK